VLELTPLRDRDVSSLSGGERQRVALGRALCAGAGLLLLDEPLAGLDLPLRRRLLPYLFRVREEFRIPMLYVSHDATEVRTLCDEVLVLRAGRVEVSGGTEDIFARSGVFPGSADDGHDNVLRGKIIETSGGSASLALEPDVRLIVPGQGLAPGQDAVVGLRSEDLILATVPPTGLSAQNILPAQVLEIRAPAPAEVAGAPIVVVLGLGRARRPVLATITEDSRRRLAIREGQSIHIVCKTQSCRVLATH
jgi:molybdate transport system ATP-binding protein